MKKQQKKLLLSVCSAFAAIAMVSGSVVALQTAKADASTFEMIYGAGIRTSDPTGIRFKAKVDETYYMQLKNGTDNAELHVALIPYAMYTAYQADSAKETTALYPWLVSKYSTAGIVDLNIPVEKMYTLKEGAETYYCANGVLSNVYFNNYHLEFVGVAYIQRGTAGNYTYEDVGEINAEDNARSIFEVACKASENETDYAKYKDFLDLTIEKGMYRAYGVSCQESVDAEGNKTIESYTYNGNTYATYDAMKAGVGVTLSESAVMIEGETISVSGGEQKQLNATVTFSDGTIYTKNPYYTWESSDESVVTVDENGVITAKGVGSTTITVSALGGRFFDSCVVNVAKGGTVNLDYQFLAQGDAGYLTTETGNATIDLTDAGIVGTNVTKVMCNGIEVAIANKTQNSITLNNALAGMQEYTFETTAANYVMEGCVYNQGISTKDEFIAWQTAAAAGTGKGYTVLLDNIDLEGVTLATPTTYYYGTFDGMGHTVTDFTYTKGAIWMMYPSVIKNVQFMNATQDCTFAGTAVVQYGFFGQVIRGTVENVKVSTATINVGAVHRSVIAFAFNNGNTATAPAVLQNVIFEVAPQTDFEHYAYQARASVAELASIDSVYMYFTNGGKGGFDIWGAGGPYTNSGFYASQAAMLAAVDFSTWAEPWQVDANGVPYIGEPVVRETIELSGEFMAKGDAGYSTTNTGNATFDLSATGYDFSGTARVLCNGEAVTLAGKTATSVTVTDAPAGAQGYTIVTPEADYIINGFVYNRGISTKEEFLAWHEEAASGKAGVGYTVLLSDVDLGGVTLPETSDYFRGTFDGMGHTVSNFTYGMGFIRMYACVVKNVQFTKAVQDCSFAGTGAILYGFFWNNVRGRVENVKISVTTKNVGNIHRAVIACVFNNSNTAGVAGVLQNVVAEVTPEIGFAHYAYQQQATVEGLSSIDSTYMYFTNGAEGGFDIWAGGGVYTNSGFYASQAAMLAEVDFSTWAEPWQVDANGVPYIGKAKENTPEADKQREVIGDTIDAPTTTNNVNIDFTGIIADIQTVSSVLCGTMNINYMANGNVLTLINVPKGEKTYTIETDSKIYFVNINVYEVEKTVVTIEEVFYAKANGGIGQNAPTGVATLDFTGSAVTLGNVQSVTFADGTAANYAVNGNVLTLTNAPGGEKTYIINTDTHIYTINICVYVQGISTIEEFETYRTHGANWAYTILLNDIDFGGATLAGTTAWLRGPFDGRGHTISNLTLEASLFGNVYGTTGAIKNLRIDATQDCTNIVTASVNAVRNGFLTQTCNGTIENVYIRGNLINLPEGAAHWGVVAYNTNNANATIKNVVICIESNGTAKHMAVNTNTGIIDNVYLVYDGVGTAVVTDYANATNTGVYASEAALAAKVDFSAWPAPWETVNGIPYIGEPVAIEKQTIEVKGNFFAKGDGSTTVQKAPTGNATIDFADTGVKLNTVQSVTYGEENTAVSYTANGNALTLVNAPAGVQTYTIVTSGDTYILDVCVYVTGISTAEELLVYRLATNYSYAVLLNDIDMEGAEIPATANYLRGTFDGLGHTIANCTLQASLFGNLYQNSGVIKNLQLINVTQDCTNIVTTSVSAVRYGFLVQTANGTIENILIKGEVINMPEGIAHWGLICYNGTPVIKNAIVNVKSMGSTKKLMAANIGGGTLDSVYMVLNDKTLASISNVTDLATATNVGVYATDSIMMASVDFSTWAEPWIIENGKLPYMSDYSEYLGFIHDEYVGTTSYNLIENGTSQYKVLLNGETYETLWAQYIDFRTYLAEATGVTLAWSNDAYASNYNDSAKFISLGKTAALEKSGIAVDYDLLGTQGYQIITLGDDIYIIGENDGLSYAVYDLLNRLVGLEVYTTTRYAIDQVDVVALPDLAITEVPDIEYRTPANGELSQYTTECAATRRALRLNQSDSIIAASGRAHNVTTHIVPYDEWGNAKPNWFEKSGAQLCYTAHGNTADYNAMVAEAVANIKALLLAEPTKTLFSITQMDTRTWCTCTACKALNTKYGTDAVSQIYFVNDVTDALNEWLENEQNGREVQFAIFAYYTTKTAPATQNADGSWTAMDETVILNDNVSVWIAPIEDDFRVNINQTNSSNNMRTMVESWSACAGSYFIWSYDTYFNNYMIPYDTYDAIQDMIRFCAEYNTKYFFVNGAWDLTQNTSFGDLKAYLHAKLMWNCNLDVNTLINNFFDDVYKEAGDTMKSVFEAWRAKSATFGGNIYSSSDSWYEIYRAFDSTWLKKQLGLLETAISQISAYKTSDFALYTEIYDSIVAESISLRYLYKERNGSEYSSSAWGKLADDAARLGVNRVSEGVSF